MNKIIFMGTSAFAVPALTALNKSIYEVALVVTQPDRPKGRGRKLLPSPVKAAAVNMGFDLIQPEKINTDEFDKKISEINPDLFVVAAYGHKLTEQLLKIPPKGTVNIHPSLLPKYRGPAPIQWAIINMEQKTGVTTMLMDKGLDTGAILQTAESIITLDDTTDTLGARLSLMGADLLLDTIDNLTAEKIKPVPQNNDSATYAPLFKKKDGHIDWATSARNIEAFIRGVTPWPGAFTFLSGKRLKIFKAAIVQGDAGVKPGTVLHGFDNELRIATGKEMLSITELQGASGKRLAVEIFLRGCKIPPGTILS